MLYLNTTPGKAGAINLKELAEVRRLHMPSQAVRFADEGQLHRVAAEVTSQHPHLREETQFVVADELGRRDRLNTSMLAVEGGRRRG